MTLRQLVAMPPRTKPALVSSTITVPANAILKLSVSSSVAAYLAYGTTSFPMEFSLPYTTTGMG